MLKGQLNEGQFYTHGDENDWLLIAVMSQASVDPSLDARVCGALQSSLPVPVSPQSTGQ